MDKSEFIQKLIEAHKQGFEIMFWDSFNWCYIGVTDIRQATEKDVRLCNQTTPLKIKEKDIIVELHDEFDTIKPLSFYSEKETIVFIPIDISLI